MGKASGPIGELCGRLQTGWKAATEDEGDQREREKASQPAVVPSRKFPGENGHHPVLQKSWIGNQKISQDLGTLPQPSRLSNPS